MTKTPFFIFIRVHQQQKDRLILKRETILQKLSQFKHRQSYIYAMEFVLLCTAKTDSKEIKALCDVYEKRLKHYCRFRIEEISTPKIQDAKKLSQKEGELILERIQTADTCILLDELGKEMNSEGFSVFVQKQLNTGAKRCFFVIGGPFGFSEAVRARADGKISLSQMTFTHQMIRLFFTEQLYRAFTILKNEPYHHNG